MTFITGSITNANPGPALYAAIETAALADGWTLEDTRVIGGNTHKVLKSAAAGNTYALDWYLDINYPTTGTTGGIRFCPFEGYNAGTGVALRGPHVASSATVDPTTYSRYGATASALETNWANNGSYNGLSTALTTAAFNYWVSITRDRIIVMLSNSATTIAYTGFFTPSAAHAAHAGAALFPLIMTVVGSGLTRATSTTPGAALTRAPKTTSINWSTSVNIPCQNFIVAGIVGGQAGVAASDYTNLVTVAALPVVMGYSSVDNSTPLAANVGSLDGVAAAFVSASAVRGDTLTIGSDTWYVCSPAVSFTLLFKGV